MAQTTISGKAKGLILDGAGPTVDSGVQTSGGLERVMAVAHVNGVNLYYELHGAGEPLVLVHGSWGDTTGWDLVLPGLADTFQVLVYDRRGHTRSERLESQGSVDEDGDDLAGLLETLALVPAHVVTSSWGGNIALRLACRRPEVFRSLTCHEPPVWGLLVNDPDSRAIVSQGDRSLESVGSRIAAGDDEGAARQFVDEVAFDRGAWDQLPPEAKEVMVRNAPTFLDELRDPNALSIQPDALPALEMEFALVPNPLSGIAQKVPSSLATAAEDQSCRGPAAGINDNRGTRLAGPAAPPDPWSRVEPLAEPEDGVDGHPVGRGRM